jgi:hypothetical protein
LCGSYEDLADGLSANRLEELVANSAANDELVIRVTPARCLVDDPPRAMDKAQVLSQVLPKFRKAVKRDTVPQATTTHAPKQSIANNHGDRVIGRSIARELGPGRHHNAEPLKSSDLATLHVSEDSRVRPRIDQHPTRREDSMNLAEGIDHALSCHASK